jgi:hypothetical protein
MRETELIVLFPRSTLASVHRHAVFIIVFFWLIGSRSTSAGGPQSSGCFDNTELDETEQARACTEWSWTESKSMHLKMSVQIQKGTCAPKTLLTGGSYRTCFKFQYPGPGS